MLHTLISRELRAQARFVSVLILLTIKMYREKKGTLNFLENDQLKDASKKYHTLCVVPLKLLYYATTDRK